MAEKSLLAQRIRVTPLIVCDVVYTPTGARASIYPVDIHSYFHTHQSIDLTERELGLILEAVKTAKESKRL